MERHPAHRHRRRQLTGWWSLLPGAAALAVLAVGPGALALRLLGVRGLAGLAAGTPVTLAGVGVLSVAYAPLGIPWRLPTVLAGLAVLLGVTWLLGRLVSRNVPDGGVTRRSGPLGTRWATVVGAAVLAAFLMLAAPFVAALPSADAPLQQWDAVFHLNAVLSVRDTGIVTPIGGLAPLYGNGTLAPYYPTGWHALISVAPGLGSVTAATNVGILVLGTGVWLLGLAGLARETFQRTLPAVLAPLLAAAFIAFPAVQLTVLAQLAHGLSTALLPGALLLVVRAVRAVQAPEDRGTAVVVAALAAVLGLVVAHASGAFSLAVLAGPLLVAAVLAWALRTARAGRRVLGAGTALTVAVVVVVGPFLIANLDAFAGVVGFARASGRAHIDVLEEVLLDRTLVHAYPYDGVWQHVGIALAVTGGAVLLLRHRRHRWLVVSYALAVTLTVLAAGPDNPLRWLAGFWYTQAARIAPVTVVPAVLLAAYALARLVRWSRGRPRSRAVVAGVAVLVMASAVVRLPLQYLVTASAYVPGELAWGTMATEEELVLMRRAGQTLPDDAVVVGDPFNGAALLPAIGGVDVVYPQLGASGLAEAHWVLRERLADIHEDPAVCAALAELGATHLYQDTAGTAEGAKLSPQTAGMRDVDVSTGFTEVDSEGTAALYRIEVCD